MRIIKKDGCKRGTEDGAILMKDVVEFNGVKCFRSYNNRYYVYNSNRVLVKIKPVNEVTI